METFTKAPVARQVVLIGLLLTMAGCGGGGDTGGPDCRYNENWVNGQCRVDFNLPPLVIPDGIFRGADPGGRVVTALISRASEIRYIDGLGRVGSGTIAVGTSNIVGSAIQLVAAYGETFSDGSTAADCLLSGTIIEYTSLTLSKECTTGGGLQFDEDLILSFDPLYNRSASLAIVAGLYETPAGDVLDIAADGVIFSQSGTTGCVMRGSVTTIASFGNMYTYEYGVENCTGQDTIWNGSSYRGLATLDNRSAPEKLLFVVSGEVGGEAVSIVAENARL